MTLDEFIVFCKLKGIVTQHINVALPEGEKIPGYRKYRLRIQARAYGAAIEYKEYEGTKHILKTILTDYKDSTMTTNVSLNRITMCLLGSDYEAA